MKNIKLITIQIFLFVILALYLVYFTWEDTSFSVFIFTREDTSFYFVLFFVAAFRLYALYIFIFKFSYLTFFVKSVVVFETILAKMYINNPRIIDFTEIDDIQNVLFFNAIFELSQIFSFIDLLGFLCFLIKFVPDLSVFSVNCVVNPAIFTKPTLAGIEQTMKEIKKPIFDVTTNNSSIFAAALTVKDNILFDKPIITPPQELIYAPIIEGLKIFENLERRQAFKDLMSMQISRQSENEVLILMKNLHRAEPDLKNLCKFYVETLLQNKEATESNNTFNEKIFFEFFEKALQLRITMLKDVPTGNITQLYDILKNDKELVASTRAMPLKRFENVFNVYNILQKYILENNLKYIQGFPSSNDCLAQFKSANGAKQLIALEFKNIYAPHLNFGYPHLVSNQNSAPLTNSVSFDYNPPYISKVLVRAMNEGAEKAQVCVGIERNNNVDLTFLDAYNKNLEKDLAQIFALKQLKVGIPTHNLILPLKKF